MIGKLMTAIALSTLLCFAQEQQQGAQQKTLDVRRFVFTLAELDQGRKVNSRNFEMLCRETNRCSVKTGSRLPVATSTKDNPASVQYMDVGLSASAHYWLRRSDGQLETDVDFEMSNVLAPRSVIDSAGQGPTPVVRQTRNDVFFILAPNVLTKIASIEDLSSGHTYELSVIAKDK